MAAWVKRGGRLLLSRVSRDRPLYSIWAPFLGLARKESSAV